MNGMDYRISLAGVVRSVNWIMIFKVMILIGIALNCCRAE